MFCEKLDDLEEAFKEMHKGALFNRIVNAHLVALQCVSSLPRIRRPNSDTLDESLGEAVMNAIEIIPSCHLRLIRVSPSGNIIRWGSPHRGGRLWHHPSRRDSHHRIPALSLPQGCSGVSSLVHSVQPPPKGKISPPEIWLPVR